MALRAQDLLDLGIESILNYLRRSRADEEQERRTGEDVLQAQKELMDRVLEPLGIPYDQRSEVGSGDKISTRPVFQTVIKDLQSGKFQAIAVKEISRMGRGSYTDMGVIYDLITDKRIFIITPYKTFDPNNPSDLRQIRFELFMSREEFETTRERLFGGRVNRAMEGKWVSGEAPFGFDYNPATKKLDINEQQAEQIRAIFDLYVNGVPDGANGKRRDVSFRALATYLSRHTVICTPKGKKNWHPTYLKGVLQNERFIGILKFRTTKRVNGKIETRPEEEHIIVHDAMPRIIDQETWDKAQAKINDTAHKPRTKMDFSPCELAGLCVCYKCGGRMVRQYSVQKYEKQTGDVVEYHKEFLWCTRPGCTFVKYRSVEEDLLDVLRYFKDLSADRLREELVANLAQDGQQNNFIPDVNEYIEQRAKELKNRMNFIFEKYESGRYTDEMFDERKAEIDKGLAELSELEKKHNSEKPESKEYKIDVDVVRTNLNSLLDAYAEAEDKSDRNRIMRSVFEHVTIELIERGRGRIPSKYNIYPVFKKGLTDSVILV
ncbi:recombinase family protein [Paenibacillus sp. F411]|uniref:recombinase family protein n=1 Tax=Paenibacillus sp. F411 TaxID=2820239 RepID=UPI001AAF42CE|nr:recombinase family protein [Paenibacillus sp. F411]MBO2943561.1 recombinase family protein [Paenibacillus sp. F411]